MAFQGDSIFWVEVEKIVPNPFQPRREFDENRLKELSESVRMYGILQPLTVTRREIQNEDGSFRSEYELIAGERRLRASKLAGLAQVPVIIREGEQSEQEKLELAIIENLQREDLNAVDRALAFRQLADVFGLSHTQVAQKVGRSREYVSNTIRLLALPDYMLNSLRTADISEGHARTLLMLNDRPEEQDTVFREILLKKLSVREVERIARGIATEKIRKKGDYDADLVELEKKFTETLGTRVSIVKTEFGGRLSIDYFTQDDLEEMLLRMRREATQITAVAPTILAAPLPQELGPVIEPGELGNPRADELAILTTATGLEIVPESAAATVVAIPVPLQVVTDAADGAVFVPEQVPEVFSPAPTPEPIIQIPVVATQQLVPVEPIGMPEVTPIIPVTAGQGALAVPTIVPEVLEAIVSTQQTTPLVSPIISVPPPPVVPIRSSLREQLASLLGSTLKSVQPMVVSEPPAAPVPPTVLAVSDVPPHAAQAVSPVLPPAQTPNTDDDSNLYDLKNFSI